MNGGGDFLCTIKGNHKKQPTENILDKQILEDFCCRMGAHCEQFPFSDRPGPQGNSQAKETGNKEIKLSFFRDSMIMQIEDSLEYTDKLLE